MTKEELLRRIQVFDPGAYIDEEGFIRSDIVPANSAFLINPATMHITEVEQPE